MEHTELTLDGLILICLCADLFELKAAKPLSKKQFLVGLHGLEPRTNRL